MGDDYIRETSNSNKLDPTSIHPTVFHTQDAAMEMLSKGYKLGLIRAECKAFITNIASKQEYRMQLDVDWEIAMGILGNLVKFRTIEGANTPTIEMWERK